jgi:choline dehydrogenase-like flavoprotein
LYEDVANLEIVVIGMGYTGIPMAAMLANIEGFNVIGCKEGLSGRDGKSIFSTQENVPSEATNRV